MIEKILGLFTNYPDKTGKDLSAENLNEITFKINALIDMILPMFEKLGLISDWVVERGSNANVGWEKWNSGKLVQRGVIKFDRSTVAQGLRFEVSEADFKLHVPFIPGSVTLFTTASVYNGTGAFPDFAATFDLISPGVFAGTFTVTKFTGDWTHVNRNLSLGWVAYGTWK